MKRLEQRLAAAIPVHPNLLSAAKLLIVTPLLFLALKHVSVIALGPALVVGLFVLFGALDYLDGVVARGRGLMTRFGRVFDRVTDYPLLLGLSYLCLDVLPKPLVMVKIGVDLLLLAVYIAGRGSSENRLRTIMSYSTLLTLLVLSQGWLPGLVTSTAVTALLVINVAFSATVALYNLDILQKRFIADALSLSNLACGVASMVMASRARFDLALLLLLVGATFDGLDGAAARKWGGTRWGVYSDDVADAVNFAIAPGVAVYFALGGLEGVFIGGFFALFTISRLVFFTLNKEGSDADYFNGVPSTVGGLITLCALVLLPGHRAIVGLLVGLACAQMVSFGISYRHLGRAAVKHRRSLLAKAPLVLVPLALSAALFGTKGAVAVLLTACLGYGLMPVASSFAAVGRRRALLNLDAVGPEIDGSAVAQ